MRRHRRGNHAYTRPDDHHAAEDAAHVEALERVAHGVQPRQHAKVEEGGRPAESRGVNRWRISGRVRYGELEVIRHAEENGGPEDRLVVVDQAICSVLAAKLGRGPRCTYSRRSWLE